MSNKIIACMLLVLTISCRKVVEPEAPEKIFEKFKSSVVLIASQYYYEIHYSSNIIYYSPDSKSKLFYLKDNVLDHLSFSTGTGFIISDQGEIITNNHVVNHIDDNYRKEIEIFFQKAKTNIVSDVKKYNDTISELKSIYDQYSDYMDVDQLNILKKKYKLVASKKEFLVDLYNKVEDIDFSEFRPKLVIHKLGIAYNDTHVTEFDDLQECVVVKTSDKEEVDLALIQTKSKSFSVKPDFIFNFKDNNPNIIENPDLYKERDIKNPVKINDDVFMIGFNRGFSLARTRQGIKSQFTTGKISQESDGERILYTIPTLEGSSGSPIVDKWGNLVGVNFAKLTDSQNFSFAVPVNEVKKFYEN